MTTTELRGDQLIAARRLPAPPQVVCRTFTTAGGVAAFWGGSHATVPADSVRIDLRSGGEFSLDTRSPDGEVRRLRFIYLAVEEPTRLAFDEPATGIRTSISIEADGAASFLTIHQSKLPAELRTDQAREGLASMVDALAAHLGAQDSKGEVTS
ncbi:SRPBCC family protein [Aeromicrobium phragmitis]|nr:SRPBCC domain-containing protein [Aeromicrobium phragmitis]